MDLSGESPETSSELRTLHLTKQDAVTEKDTCVNHWPAHTHIPTKKLGGGGGGDEIKHFRKGKALIKRIQERKV